MMQFAIEFALSLVFVLGVIAWMYYDVKLSSKDKDKKDKVV